MGTQPFGICQKRSDEVAFEISSLHKQGIELGIVVGGGNIFRGIQQGGAWGLDRTPADQIGMLATLINGIALSQALIRAGCDVRIMSALECPTIAERYQWERAMRHLAEGRMVLFVGGTGHPYFTTDTTAALRACEIKADIFLKATTRVDGIYDCDPRKESGAKKYGTISFQEILEKRLKILDLSAVTMCMEANIPIRVFNFFEGPLYNALSENAPGTLVKG